MARNTTGENRAGHIFRLAAFSLHHSATPLGDYLRRMKARLGPRCCHHRNRTQDGSDFLRNEKNQIEYDETIWTARGTQREKRLQAKLKRQAQLLGYELVPLEHKPAA